MRLLLDTHTLLWAASDRPKLSGTSVSLIEDPDNERWVSVVSLWEITIKFSGGKLSLPQPPWEFFQKQREDLVLLLLPIELRHLRPVESLPFHHRDPFDRLLFAQSLTENIPLISVDAIADAYGVTRLWD